ncbi:MAG: hypothetical protein Q9173_007066 [Seirophora scorigena]
MQDEVLRYLRPALKGKCSTSITLFARRYRVYNVLLHPVRKFLGPKLRAATRVSWCYHQYRGRLQSRLLQLHIQTSSSPTGRLTSGSAASFRLLAHAFSKSALRKQEPILQLYPTKLLDRLSHECHDGGLLNIATWPTFASFDLIGHVSFGENFGCLDADNYAPFVRAITAIASGLTFT